jgi:octopine/nopaline transport system substrate-binding protein
MTCPVTGGTGRVVASVLALGLICLLAGASGTAGADGARLTLAMGRAGDAASTGDLAAHGFERDLAEELCRRLAAECAYVDIDRDRVVAALIAGQADAALAALPVTPAFAAIVDFSVPYAVPRHGFAVARSGPLSELPGTGSSLSLKIAPMDAQAAIDALRQALRGRRVGAEAGTADLRFLETYFGDVAKIDAYPTSDAAVGDLLAGRLDAIMAPTIDLATAGARPGFQALVRTGPEFGQDDLFGDGIAVAFRKSNPDLRNRLGRAIDGMIGDGSLRALSLRWFAIDITPHRCTCKPF